MNGLRGVAVLLGLSGLVLSQAGCMSPATLGGGGNAAFPPSGKGTDPADGEPLTPQLIPVCLSLGQSLEQKGDVDMAVGQYERVIKVDPANARACRRLAFLYDHRKEFDKAEVMYAKVAKATPRDADVFNDWGRSYYLRGDWKQAEDRFRRALQVDHNHTRARCNLALTFGQQDRFQEAYQTFLDARLGEAEANCNMAVLLWSRGRAEEARLACETALRIDPHSKKAQDVLARMDPAARPAEPITTVARRPEAPSASQYATRPPPAVAPGIPASGNDTLPLGRMGQLGSKPTAAGDSNPQPVYRSPNGTAWVPVSPARQDAAPPMADELLR